MPYCIVTRGDVEANGKKYHWEIINVEVLSEGQHVIECGSTSVPVIIHGRKLTLHASLVVGKLHEVEVLENENLDILVDGYGVESICFKPEDDGNCVIVLPADDAISKSVYWYTEVPKVFVVP